MVIFSPVQRISLKYLLGLINSRLLSAWFLRTFDKLQRRIFPQFKVKELGSFPIRPIDFSNPQHVVWHDKVVELVEQILTLQEQRPMARTAFDKTFLQRQINSTDHQIDRLVYEIYGLTEDEIEIVEG